MKLHTNVADIWVFHRGDGEPRYLLLHTSQEKADRWFGGGRFWQIPAAFVREGEDVVATITALLKDRGLTAKSIWAVEHAYIIYNRRRRDVEIIPVFAAEVETSEPVRIDWEYSEARWATAKECFDLVTFRGLREGLERTIEYVTGPSEPRPEFRLA